MNDPTKDTAPLTDAEFKALCEVPGLWENPDQITYCTPGDLIGTPRPDGGYITRADDDDLLYIQQAAVAVECALEMHPDPTGKVALVAARWANIIGAVDLRCLGEPGPATELALSVFLPVKLVQDLDG